MTPKNRNKPLVPYMRQSKKRERSISIEEQASIIEKWASDNGVELVPKPWIAEQNVSGSKSWRERGLGSALEQVEQGEAQGIIVAFQDRLSREHGLATAEVWAALESAQARLVCAGEGLDTATGDHEMLFTIKAAIAREGWKRQRLTFEQGVTKAIERGVHTGKIPFGYDRPPAIGAEAQALVPDPETAHLVREAFERRAKGETLQKIADFLNEVGAPKRYSKDQTWGVNEITKILANEVYLGVARYGEHRNENAHEALIDRELFLRVSYLGKTRGPSRTTVNPLQGLVRCHECDGPLVRSVRRNPSGKAYSHYRCRTKGCFARSSISGQALESYLWPLVAQEAALRIEKPRSQTSAAEAARSRLEAAREALAAFDATVEERGLDPVDAVVVRGGLRKRVEEAERDFAATPVEDEGDWVLTVKALAEAVAEKTPVEWAGKFNPYGDGITGDYLDVLLSVEIEGEHELAAKLNELRTQAARALVRKVVVTGSKGPAEGRVEVELVPAPEAVLA